MHKVDIAIVGGGVTGLILREALFQAGYDVILCDANEAQNKTHPSFDARSIALNQASIEILKALALWEPLSLHATPIQTIHVSSQHQYGTSKLQALKGEAPLGHVVEMHRFYAALLPRLPQDKVFFGTTLTDYDLHTNTLSFKKKDDTLSCRPTLVIGADGTHSVLRRFTQLSVKKWPVRHYAVLANLSLRRSHGGSAYERFTSTGPLALLPLENNRMSLVWCLPETRAKALVESSEADFLSALYEAFGYRLGWFKDLGRRVCVPLEQSMMSRVYEGPMVFVGNAAQTLHPVAGQGLNLGLRDIAHLVQCLVTQGLSLQTLAYYQRLRDQDRRQVIQALDLGLDVFQSESVWVRYLRSTALSLFDQCTFARSMLIRYASGLGGQPPDLACGFSLSSLRNQ